MKPIPATENPVIIRTDFTDRFAWNKLVEVARAARDPFIFQMEFIQDRDYDGATAEELRQALPADYQHSFMVVADRAAMSGPGFALLVVDLVEKPGRQFRSIAECIASIENNLSIGNMGFDEFADAAGDDGIFRGFPE